MNREQLEQLIYDLELHPHIPDINDIPTALRIVLDEIINKLRPGDEHTKVLVTYAFNSMLGH